MEPTQPGSAHQPEITMIRDLAEADHGNVILLIQELVRIPTRGGIDTYDAIMDHVSRWLNNQGLDSRLLHERKTGRAVALVCDIAGDHPGPRYVLDACLDTAPFGDVAAWRHAPTSATIDNGWLYGRGSADSKAAIAIFMHIVKHLHKHTAQMHGTLTLLFDADEHTGHFGGAKQYFDGDETVGNIGGVMIGYPGSDQLVIGGRGFLRAQITIRGQAGHTGSQRTTDNTNAIEKAAELVSMLTQHRLPGPTDTHLGLPPKITVTAITGGESYSIIPDHCTISVDVRLTTTFHEASARKLIEDTVAEIDKRWPVPDKPTEAEYQESWPAYRLDDNAPIRVALMRAAEHHLDHKLTAKVAGPSNIGNYLAKLGIDSTAGLGVNYHGLHGTDERIELATIPTIQAIYHEAALSLLSS